MQQIFFNGKIHTLTSENVISQAMLVNDGIVVLVGDNQEILDMKTDDTIITDLNDKHIYPTLFGFNENLFFKIEQEIKNANKFDVSKNSADNDENYEKFTHFDAYKKEFLKLQNELITAGITTIQEMGITKRSFTFWKKLSEAGFLKIDIIGYVDIKSSKIVMDENCKSYRKYKNHFRLGGYYLELDGKIKDIKAWLNKPYSHSKEYCGYGEYYGEQLSCLIKEALNEKKQIVVAANGDKAIDEFLTTFEEVVKQEKVEDVFRPMFIGAEILSKKHIKRLANNNFAVCFEIDENQSLKNVKSFIGGRRTKNYLNVNAACKEGLNVVVSGIDELKNKLTNIYADVASETKKSDFISKKHKITLSHALQLIFNNSSYLLFDQELKGSLENGKQASFIVLEKPLEEFINEGSDIKILDVYINGEK